MEEDLNKTSPAAVVVEGGIMIYAAGGEWFLERQASLEDLWQNMAEGDFDENHIPYWAEVWPASLLLAEWLRERREEITRRLCVDLGCGLGLTALVGQCQGARVLALDYEAPAICHTIANALANHVESPLGAVMDWRNPAVRRGRISRIWGADILYEKRHMRSILEFLAHSLEPHGKVWLAAPQRPIFYDFLEMAKAAGWLINLAKAGDVRGPYSDSLTSVSVWEMGRPETG